MNFVIVLLHSSFWSFDNQTKRITKMFKKLLQDPEQPLLGPNYWILRKTALILPENLKIRSVRLVIHLFGFLFVSTQYMELFVIGWDLDPLITNLKYSMLSIICTTKAITFIFHQKKWRDIIDYVTEADRYERAHKNKARSVILDSYTKYCHQLTISYLVLVFMTFNTVVGSPLIKYLSSTSFRQALSNGTEQFPHIFSSWSPYDKYHSPGSWIHVGIQLAVSVYGSSVMAAYDSSAMVLMVFFEGKLELLRQRCKEMFGRVTGGMSEDETVNDIRELHQIHVQLIK